MHWQMLQIIETCIPRRDIFLASLWNVSPSAFEQLAKIWASFFPAFQKVAAQTIALTPPKSEEYAMNMVLPVANASMYPTRYTPTKTHIQAIRSTLVFPRFDPVLLAVACDITISIHLWEMSFRYLTRARALRKKKEQRKPVLA